LLLKISPKNRLEVAIVMIAIIKKIEPITIFLVTDTTFFHRLATCYCQGLISRA